MTDRFRGRQWAGVIIWAGILRDFGMGQAGWSRCGGGGIGNRPGSARQIAVFVRRPLSRRRRRASPGRLRGWKRRKVGTRAGTVVWFERVPKLAVMTGRVGIAAQPDAGCRKMPEPRIAAARLLKPGECAPAAFHFAGKASYQMTLPWRSGLYPEDGGRPSGQGDAPAAVRIIQG